MTLTKYLLVSSAIILISALQVWSVDNTNVNTCKDQACSTPFSFYHEGYPDLRSETDNLFEQRFKGDRIFTLSSDAKVQAWDGSVRTVEQHFDWMKAHIIEHASPDAPGFVKTGEKEGVLWETHEELTIKHRGVGYFRLKATVDVDPKTFACLMADPHLLFAMDATVRVMDFERSPTYPQNIKGKRKVWLAYFQQAVSFCVVQCCFIVSPMAPAFLSPLYSTFSFLLHFLLMFLFFFLFPFYIIFYI